MVSFAMLLFWRMDLKLRMGQKLFILSLFNHILYHIILLIYLHYTVFSLIRDLLLQHNSSIQFLQKPWLWGRFVHNPKQSFEENGNLIHSFVVRPNETSKSWCRSSINVKHANIRLYMAVTNESDNLKHKKCG